jgi:hypothetical protein
MPFAIALVALQAAAQAPPPAPQPGGMMSHSTPPPPVIVHTMPGPVVAGPPGPPGRPLVHAIPEANEAPPDVIEMRVTSGSEKLWEGRLRVGRTSASLIQYIHEAEPAGCPASDHGRSVYSNVNVSLQRWKLSTTPAGAFNYQLRVSWQRPSSPHGCLTEGSRTVEVNQGLDLKPGQAITLKGDVGLVVWVRRR